MEQKKPEIIISPTPFDSELEILKKNIQFLDPQSPEALETQFKIDHLSSLLNAKKLIPVEAEIKEQVNNNIVISLRVLRRATGETIYYTEDPQEMTFLADQGKQV